MPIFLIIYPEPGVLIGIAWFTVLIGIPAVAIGWVIQCIVVVIRSRMSRARRRRLRSLLIGD